MVAVVVVRRKKRKHRVSTWLKKKRKKKSRNRSISTVLSCMQDAFKYKITGPVKALLDWLTAFEVPRQVFQGYETTSQNSRAVCRPNAIDWNSLWPLRPGTVDFNPSEQRRGFYSNVPSSNRWHLIIIICHHHLSLNREGCWGTTGDFATSFLHLSLFSTARCDLAISCVHALNAFAVCAFCFNPVNAKKVFEKYLSSFVTWVIFIHMYIVHFLVNRRL